MPGSMLRKHFGSLGAALLLLVFLCELTLSIRGQSLSWDEVDHVFAGYMSWKAADFGLNPEHPPLVKALAAFPLLGMRLTIPPPKGLAFFKDEAFLDGRDFVFAEGEAGADRIMFRSRMAAATLSLLLGILVFLAAREMFGVGAALFALTLLVFEPNLIAHGAYVTTDMGIACFMFASIFAFYRYAKSPSWGRVAVVGVAAGLALAAKHSALVLLPIGLALVLTEICWPPSGERVDQEDRKAVVLRLSGAFLVVSVSAITLLWSCYDFRFSARPGGVGMSPSLAEYAQGLKGVEPHLYVALARWHILPESYLYGLTDVRLLSNSFPTYIFGEVHAHGVWFYFPAAFLIKSTAAFLLLLLVAVYAVARGSVKGRREILFVTLPPIIYMLVATGTGLNIGARHILPMYPFLCVLIAGAVAALARQQRRWAYVVGVLLLWHAVSASRAYPVYLAYSNEFWGGPANTYRYLSDSNTDWGQQLKAVKQYLDGRGVKECWFAYFVDPLVHPSAYGIPCSSLPTQDTIWTHYQVDTPTTVQGPVLISAGTLSGFEFGSKVLSPYTPFQRLHPTAVIQHGVFVYDGTFDMRFASALGHVTRAMELMAGKQMDAALAEAQMAVQVDADVVQAQMILGDVLSAMGRPLEAKPHYESALALAYTMEPSVEAEWVPQIQKKMAGR